MIYEIIEVHVIFLDTSLKLVAVLWMADDRGGVRATYCTNKPCAGYNYLLPGDQISDKLIQKVAALGMNVSDAMKDKYFPGKRMWTH